MKTIIEMIKAEPAMFQGVIQACLGMLMSFGLNMTADQMGSVLAFTAIVLAFITRQQVTPNHIVAEKVEVALNTPCPPRHPDGDSPMNQLKPEKPA